MVSDIYKSVLFLYVIQLCSASIVNQQDSSKVTGGDATDQDDLTVPDQLPPRLFSTNSGLGSGGGGGEDRPQRTSFNLNGLDHGVQRSKQGRFYSSPVPGWKCDQKKNVCTNDGRCTNGFCECPPGWTGRLCEACNGRIIKIGDSGFVVDGPSNYTRSARCSWILKSERPDNTSRNVDDPKGRGVFNYLTLHLNHFTTECCWNYLHVYDGPGATSDKLAALSGRKTADGTVQLALNSNSAFLHFWSDVVGNVSGFNISYEFSTCDDDCSKYDDARCDQSSGRCVCRSPPRQDDSHHQCKVPSCTQHCKYGACTVDGVCDCKTGYKGPSCDINTARAHWTLVATNHSRPKPSAGHAAAVLDNTLLVTGGHNFELTNNIVLSGYNFRSNEWTDYETDVSDETPRSRYSHTAVVYDDSFYIFGGILEPFNVTNEFWRLDILPTGSKITQPPSLFNMSDAEDENAGNGRAVWHRLRPHTVNAHAPYHAHGHTSHVIGKSMLTFGGYNPYRGFLNAVQEYNFANESWSVLEVVGAEVPALAGHSSVLDPRTDYVYLYGGYGSSSQQNFVLYDHLFVYIHQSRKWLTLPGSGQPTFLHSASFVNDLMLVVGGNAYCERSHAAESTCFQTSAFVYDIDCSTWHKLNQPAKEDDRDSLALYGHKTATYKKQVFLYGGFDGQFSNNLLSFIPGDCSNITDEDRCKFKSASVGAKCSWYKSQCWSSPQSDSFKSASNPPERKVSRDKNKMQRERRESLPAYCSGSGPPAKLSCRRYADCQTCASDPLNNCKWCPEQHACSGQKCQGSETTIDNVHYCPARPVNCSNFHSCNVCKTQENCIWDRKSEISDFYCIDLEVEKLKEYSYALINKDRNFNLCYKPCPFLTSCEACAKAQCTWCSNLKRCVESNAYTMTFPYGQCTQWTNSQEMCPDLTECSAHLTCAKCQDAGPRCGWCDDGSQTGVGRCMEGTLLSPSSVSACPTGRWYFTKCPACQCNGHSKCDQQQRRPSTVVSSSDDDDHHQLNESLWGGGGSGSSTDSPFNIKHAAFGSKSLLRAKTPSPRRLSDGSQACSACGDKTTGDQCESCIDGYHGNALNGGNCTPCECNSHALSCHPVSGKCYCSTKGIIGSRCDKCDPKYIGNPINSTCYYELLVDFLFAFSLNKEEDKHVTRLNFLSKPIKPDVDVLFKIKCEIFSNSNSAPKFDLNVTNDFDLARGLGPRRLLRGEPCSGSFLSKTYTADQFHYGTDLNTTFYVTVYSFRPSTTIQVSFSQSQNIDWMRFFVTFALCFFILLVLAFALWKIKQKIDLYRRRQRLFVEMAQMASRPFGVVTLDWSTPPDLNKKQYPTAVSVEPCANFRAAVVTVALKMPTGGAEYAAHGQSGLALASALCYMTPGQVMQLQTPPTPQIEEKTRKRRRPTCIS